MKVLIISHNAISETNNMGKTLLSYFQDFSPDEVAEFYIQDKVPVNASVVRSYYRVTDRDALKSVFGFKAGTAFKLEESLPEKESAKTGVLENIRQYGRKRNAIVYTLRNAVWSLSHWNTKRFKSWLRDFDPDVIFFMAGDYSFMFKITLTVQKALNKPLAVCCVDDFFMYNRNEKTALGRHQHRSYKKIFRRVMEKASCIFTISDSMGEIYRKLFGKPCFTLHTSAPKRISADDEERKGISYFGNLGFKRFEQLSDIGKAVKKLCIPGFDCINV